MRKVGTIIAIIAGLLGVFVGGVTLIKGLSLSGPFSGIGLIFLLLVVIFGVVDFRNAQSWIPRALLIVCAIAGAILGDLLVLGFSVLAFLGGCIALFGPMIPGQKTTVSS